MFNISQVSAGPVHETADTLQMAPYNVRAMARFVNIHKQGLREQAQQNEKMHLELVKYIDTSKTQGFNDLQEAKLELVNHIDTWTNGYSDLLLEQLNSVSAEKKVLSERNAEITASLEVERELKRSKTEAFDRQGVELECVKKENYALIEEAVRLREEVKTTIQTNNDFASEVSRHNAVIHELRQQVGELNRDNKQLENEKASLYQLQQKCNSNDPPPRRFSVPQPGQW